MINIVSIIKSHINEIFFNIMSQKNNVAKFRIYIILIFIILGYTIISLRLFSVTATKSLTSQKHSFAASKYNMNTNVNRAEIIDRNGELLAININTTSVYANPKFIKNPGAVAKKLIHIFPQQQYQDLLKKFQSNRSFIWIKRNITPKEEQKLHNLGIPGIYFENNTKRAYPHGSLFSHVLGYVSLDGKGLSGVERYFNHELTDIKKKSLQLSLDTKAQNIIRNELLTTIKEFNATGGLGILQDTTNGEIIALVNLPDYDPHDLNKVSEESLFNKATLGNYEVGSLFKVFTVAMALDNGTIQLNDVYDVDTPLQLAGYKINDYRGKGGWLSVPEILMYSSNIGTSQIALEMGKEEQFKYLKNLGFLSSINLELYEKSNPSYSSLSKWNDLTSATVSYGHGISVSPMHTVRAMCAVVNGGILYNSTLIKTQSKNLEYRRVLKESTSYNMRKLLRMSVKFGSGSKSEVSGMFVGGKTGTANKVVNGKYQKGLRISSFISTFPTHTPKYVMLISIDEPKGNKESFGFATGGWVATKPTARIIEKLIPILGLMPENEQKENIEKSLFLNYNPSPEIL